MQSLREFSFGGGDEAIVEQLARLYAVETGPLGGAARDTIAAVKRLRDIRAKNDPPGNGAAYPQHEFGRGLREIARLIKANVGLVTTTIDLNGWDTHFVQASVINSLMTTLASGLDAFLTDLGPLRERAVPVLDPRGGGLQELLRGRGPEPRGPRDREQLGSLIESARRD